MGVKCFLSYQGKKASENRALKRWNELTEELKILHNDKFKICTHITLLGVLNQQKLDLKDSEHDKRINNTNFGNFPCKGHLR